MTEGISAAAAAIGIALAINTFKWLVATLDITNDPEHDQQEVRDQYLQELEEQKDD